MALPQNGAPLSSLLEVPDEVFAVIIRSGSIDHGISMLRELRAVCNGLRTTCSTLSEELYQTVLDRSSYFCTCFPTWSTSSGIAECTQLGMGEWVMQYTEKAKVLMRRLQRQNEEQATPSSLQACATVCEAGGVRNVSEFLAELDDTTRAERLWYTLVNFDRSSGGERTTYHWFRIHLRALHHVKLPSVITWFAQFGWHLDSCAALLFLRRCAQAVDAGSTWMVMSCEALSWMLETHNRLVSISRFILQLIDEQREAEMLLLVRQRFDADWTAAMHGALRMLCDGTFEFTAQTGFAKAFLHHSAWTSWFPNRGQESEDKWYGMKGFSWFDCNSDKNMQYRPWMRKALLEDFRDLRKKLMSEVEIAAQVTATVQIFERKMKACMPERLRR
jgi:hypothetical protein